jgi:hypothetical protein
LSTLLKIEKEKLLSDNNFFSILFTLGIFIAQDFGVRILRSASGLRHYTYAAGGKVPETTKNFIAGKFEESETNGWIDVCSKLQPSSLLAFF